MAERITGVKQVLKELKDLENGAINKLRREIRTRLADDLAYAARYTKQSEYEMVFGVRNAGMFHQGPKGWSTPTIRTSIRPASPKSVISITATGQKGLAGYEILEKAGSRSSGSSKSGKALITMLQKHFPPNKSGRFVYAAIQKRLRFITADVKFIIESYADQVNGRLSKGTSIDIVTRSGDII